MRLTPHSVSARRLPRYLYRDATPGADQRVAPTLSWRGHTQHPPPFPGPPPSRRGLLLTANPQQLLYFLGYCVSSVHLKEWLAPMGVPLPLIHAAAGVAADFLALPFWVLP